ncbi:hypothetical protein ACFVUS_14185 [Nocardia sp. NPDC058058]|uniref:DUF7373 family lipoprotein n=1 Tax=Nocardia sp. NPDC058058 TaxID=3346317 RepID=UPI0036DF5C52
MTNNELRRRTLRRTRACAAGLFVLSGLITGCGDGAVIAGTARPSTPDLSALDMGDLSAHPMAVPANDNDTYGRVLESVRLAEVVVKPTDTDGDLIHGGGVLLPTAGRAAALAPEIALDPIAQYGMIAGYAVSGSDDPGGGNGPTVGESKIMRMTVLNFRTDPIARLVAGRIAAADLARNPDTIRVDIPGVADAYGISRKRSPVLVTALAHKSFVIVVYLADRVVDAAALSARTAAALTAELPLLDRFQPTAPNKLSAMPFDEDGMLRRLLRPDTSKWPYPSAGGAVPEGTTWFTFNHGSGVVYGPRGISHLFGRGGTGKFESDQIDRAAFVGDWWLLRLSDLAHARTMHARIVAAATAQGDTPAATPAGVPDAACFRGKNVPDNDREARYRCFLTDGRYWAVVSGKDEKTTSQRAAAQYALLVNNR